MYFVANCCVVDVPKVVADAIIASSILSIFLPYLPYLPFLLSFLALFLEKLVVSS